MGEGRRSVLRSRPDEQDGKLVEEVEGDEYDGEGDGVTSGGDEGGEDEDDNDGVTAEFLQKVPVDDSEQGKDPQEHRHFEAQPEYQDDGVEQAGVGIEVEGVVDHRREFIAGQKAEGDGKDDEITDRASYVK